MAAVYTFDIMALLVDRSYRAVYLSMCNANSCDVWLYWGQIP